MTALAGVPVTGLLVPQDSADLYPVTDPVYQIGGWRTAATTTERDAIPAERRRAGMQVRVLADGKLYSLGSGLSNSDWTASDAAVTPHSHPISDVVGLQAALDAKAGLASPTFTGAPAGPTATAGTSTSQFATTAFATGAVSDVVGGAPGGLNTLAKLATSLGGDTAFASTVSAALAAKAGLASPAFSGAPTTPTAPVGTNTNQLASCAFVLANAITGGGAPLASPAFTGTPTAPTAALGTATTQLSNTLFVANALAALVGTAPGSLDTLGELATAIGNDPAFITTVTNALAGKQPLAASLTALGALSGITDRLAYFNSGTTMALTNFGTAARNLMAASSGNAQRRLVNAGVIALTDGATIPTDASTGNFFTVTVNGNRTFANPTGMSAGATYAWAITQGAGGNFHSSFGSAFHQMAGDVFDQSTGAGLTDLLVAISPDGVKLLVTTLSGYS